MSFPSNFDIVRRFPVLRGARSASSVTSGASDVAATSVELHNRSSSETNRSQSPEFQPIFRDHQVQHPPTSPSVFRGRTASVGLRTPARQSFDGVPSQFVYGLFEQPKRNVRYVAPRHWSPTNAGQVKQPIFSCVDEEQI